MAAEVQPYDRLTRILDIAGPSGSITLVAGRGRDDALTAIGARSLAANEHPLTSGYDVINARDLEPGDRPAAVLTEVDGAYGSGEAVLAALSKSGTAASVYWDADDTVTISCARRGKMLIQTDDLNDEGLPRSLQKVLADPGGSYSEATVALAMALKFTGTTFTEDQFPASDADVYLIAEPLLNLPATPQELLSRESRFPGLINAVTTATERARWRLAYWAAAQAVAAAGLADDPAAVSILTQGHRTHARPTPSYRLARSEHERAGKRADDDMALTPSERSAFFDDWGRRHWALQALLYLFVSDGVTAALGATYCAKVALDDRGRNRLESQSFLEDARSLVDRVDGH